MPAGTPVTVTATPQTGYAFNGWKNGEEYVSCNSTYTFIATASTSLQAEFVDHVSATITSYGYASFSSTYALDFTSVNNVEAYIAAVNNGSSISMQKVTGKVAANTGLILKSTNGGAADVTIPVTAETGTSYNTETNPTNYLFAINSDYDLKKSNNGTNYVLSVQDKKVVFAPIGTTSAPVKAGQAALWLPASGSAKALALSFGDNVTGIEAVSTVEPQGAKTYYNLQGQRVSEPKQGIYVVDGKKVLVK